MAALRVDVITGFPDIIEEPLRQSMIKKGQDTGAVEIFTHNLRTFTNDNHRTIDDYPYGGGPGMVLKVEPIVKCLEEIDKIAPLENAKIILLSPRGETLNQKKAVSLSLEKHLVFICGHYKGIDQRVYDFFNITDMSIGDYVLSSGEIGALVIIDSVVRLLPGVLKDIDSAWTDSFSDDLLDAPYFTRPEIFRGIKVPDVLTSGNHAKIEKWRIKKKIDITKSNRPDLYNAYLKQLK